MIDKKYAIYNTAIYCDGYEEKRSCLYDLLEVGYRLQGGGDYYQKIENFASDDSTECFWIGHNGEIMTESLRFAREEDEDNPNIVMYADIRDCNEDALNVSNMIELFD